MEFLDDNQSDNEDSGFQDGAGGDFFNQYNDMEATGQDFGKTKDAVIFLIDCHKDLFEIKNDQNKSQFDVILSSLQSFMKTKIIGSAEDLIGVCFTNVKQEKNALKFKGINQVYGLDNPSAERIKNVIKLVDGFEANFGLQNQDFTSLGEALWFCNDEFKKLPKDKYNMRIFYFTNNDNPHPDRKDLRDTALQHAKQLKDMDVEIELFPLEKKSSAQFIMHKFFVNILTVNADESNPSVFDTTSKIMQLEERMKQKEFKKRTLNRILFELGNNVKCGLKLFCCINKAKKPLSKPLESKTNKPLKKITKIICKDTASELMATQIGTYFEFGGQKIPLSKEEMKQIKAFETPGLRLMGFKDKASLKIYHNFRTSYFLYPDEERVKGSSQFFDALIKNLKKKDKIAIARFIPRNGSELKFCALMPQEESFDENHFQTPPGLHLIYLPYQDDIRSLNAIKPSEQYQITREQLASAKFLINSLNLNNFDCKSFEDPALQKFFAHLQAHALNEQEPEEFTDLLEPDEVGFETYKDVIKMFNDCINLGADDEKPKKAPRGKQGDKQIADKKVNKGGSITTAKRQTKPLNNKGKGKMEIESDDSRDDNDDYENDGFVVKDDEPVKKSMKNRGGKQQYSSEDDEDFSMSVEIKQKNKKLKSIKEEDPDMEKALNESRAGNIEQKLIQADMKKVTVDDLKFYLGFHNLKTTGKKQDLFTLAFNYISDKNQ